MEKTCRTCKYENGILCLHPKGPCDEFEKYESKEDAKNGKSCEDCFYYQFKTGCSYPSLCTDYSGYKPILYEKSNPIQPKHYSNGGNDVIDYCYKNDIDFLTGNIIKYVVRAGKKDKSKELEDLQKAQEYLRRRIEYLKGENK